MSRTSAPPNSFRAWLIDLDGTLYHARYVKLAMACELAMGRWRALRTIRAFRREHERLRSLPSFEADDPFQQQIESTAVRLQLDAAIVQRTIDEWMFCRPGKWLRAFRRRRLLTEVSAYRAAGGRTALVSDYPATQKLAAIGAEPLFDFVVASGEPGGPRRLKPNPDGFLLAADQLSVAPADCLVIGDRSDADGEAARRAGMHFCPIHALD
jgi:FMN phosphatase YigB (HAD superfamily)